MGRRLPNLNALRAFEAAARRLSFSLAADELGVTQGAVSRQIKSLEIYLGTTLFRRLTRAIQLTEPGRSYALIVSETFDRLERATLQLRANAQRKVITVNVLPTFAMRFLIPRLSRFNAAHPQIEIRMVMSIEPVNFGHDDVDVAIRVGSPPQVEPRRAGPRIDLDMVADWTDVRAEMLAPDILVPICSAEFLKTHGPLRTPADFVCKPLLHNASRPHAWPDWFAAMGLAFDETMSAGAYGHFFMAIEAARQGLGIALIPQVLVQPLDNVEQVVSLAAFRVESAGAYFILSRAYQWDVEALRLFRDWLLDECRQSLAAERAAPRLPVAAGKTAAKPRAAKARHHAHGPRNVSPA